MKGKAVILNQKDNVATALAELKEGDELKLTTAEGEVQVKLRAAIPFGHKFSFRKIQKGKPVLKYGETIGTATETIMPGDHVHVHNVISTRGR